MKKQAKQSKSKKPVKSGLDPVKTETGKAVEVQGGKVGRPTKYTPEMCDRIEEYFAKEPTTMVMVQVLNKKTGGLTRIPQEVAVELPTLAGFAASIGVHRDTLNEWERAHPEFSDAVKRAKCHQERILVANGLSGRYQGALSIFALKNLHDWKDKLDVTSDGKELGPTTIVREIIHKKA